MPSSGTSKPHWPVEHKLLFGQVSCLLFGLGLIVWGLAPTLAERLVSGAPPSDASLTLNFTCFIMAVLFIAFHVLIKHRVRWAAWAALILSGLILAAGVAASLAAGFSINATVVMVFAAIAFAGAWMAVEAIQKWSTEGPFARAEETDAVDAQEGNGDFVADEPVRADAAHPHHQNRMFLPKGSPKDARNVQPDLHAILEQIQHPDPM